MDIRMDMGAQGSEFEDLPFFRRVGPRSPFSGGLGRDLENRRRNKGASYAHFCASFRLIRFWPGHEPLPHNRHQLERYPLETRVFRATRRRCIDAAGSWAIARGVQESVVERLAGLPSRHTSAWTVDRSASTPLCIFFERGKLGRTRPKVAESRNISAELGPKPHESGRGCFQTCPEKRPSLARRRPSLARVRPTLVRHRPKSQKLGPESAKGARTTVFIKLGPTPTNLGTEFAQSGPASAAVGLESAKSGPMLANRGPTSTQIGSTLANLEQCWLGIDRFHRASATSGPVSAKLGPPEEAER